MEIGLTYIARHEGSTSALLDGAEFVGSYCLRVSDAKSVLRADIHYPDGTPLQRVMDALEWAIEAGSMMETGSALLSRKSFAEMEDIIGRACPIGIGAP